MEPADLWGALSPETEALLAGLGIPLAPARNLVDETYPHGNKVAALQGIRAPAVFLDSDMLLMCPFSWHPELGADIAAKPADIDTFSRGGGSWSRVWQLFNLETPAKSFTSTASREAMRPYFNAGFISVRDGDAFARMWVETVRRIDAEPRILNKRPWVDQIALPVTAARLGWEIRPLGDRFNFPCHLSDTGAASPYFAHYHWPKVIASQAPLLCRTRALLERVPGLAAILAATRNGTASCGPATCRPPERAAHNRRMQPRDRPAKAPKPGPGRVRKAQVPWDMGGKTGCGRVAQIHHDPPRYSIKAKI